MGTNKLTPQAIFRAAQSPVGWFLSAENLREAAEVVINHEDQFLRPYLHAHDAATKRAMASACSPGNDSGHAEINARAPNYPPAQMLYAFAIENVLKGLIVANDPSIINGDKLDSTLRNHDLVELSEQAAFEAYVQEVPVLRALSELALWAGRYPMAVLARDFVSAPNADELMDYGSHNSIMRALFARAYSALEAKLPHPVDNRNGAIVVFRQPGT